MKQNAFEKAVLFVMLLSSYAAAALLSDALTARFPPLGTACGTAALIIWEDTLRIASTAVWLSATRRMAVTSALLVSAHAYATRLVPLCLAFALPAAPHTVPAAVLLIAFAVRPGHIFTKNSYTP